MDVLPETQDAQWLKEIQALNTLPCTFLTANEFVGEALKKGGSKIIKKILPQLQFHNQKNALHR